MCSLLDPRGELESGVYDTGRAAALSGVPERTLHYCAQRDLCQPSVSTGPRVRLWSWLDLLALRAIDWFRRVTGRGEAPRVSIQRIRQALGELDRAGVPRERLHEVLAVSYAGDLYIQHPDLAYRADPGHQIPMAHVLSLVAAYGAIGPDLIEPRPQLRIIPGKLHGEPHLLNTRIPSAAVYNLHQSGYRLIEIQRMYLMPASRHWEMP